MAYRLTSKLIFPLDDYKVNGYEFGRKCSYNGVYWGVHLGEDIIRSAGTKVMAIGRGKVVYSAIHPGNKQKGNWGNIIIVAHKSLRDKKIFFSLYAHLDKKLVAKGDKVEAGQVIGKIGKANSPENGWWPVHLHFGIYVGRWSGKVLPGYWKPGSKRTALKDWEKPSGFIKKYNC